MRIIQFPNQGKSGNFATQVQNEQEKVQRLVQQGTVKMTPTQF